MAQQQYRLVLAALCFLLCHFGKFPANGQIGPGGGGGGGCAPQVAASVVWIQNPFDPAPGLARYPCSEIHRSLSGGEAKRRCVGNEWSDIDFSECMLRSSPTLLLVWFPLQATRQQVKNSTDPLLNDLLEVLGLDDSSAHTPSTVTIAILRQSTTSSIIVALTFPTTPPPATLTSLLQSSNISSLEERNISLGGLNVGAEGVSLSLSGYRGFYMSNHCSCEDDGMDLFRATCPGTFPFAPCQCTSSMSRQCQCQTPDYVGDGQSCTPDVDLDTYPAVPLDTCNSSSSSAAYCQIDNCPLIYNPKQNVTVCQAPPGFNGCPLELGRRLNILWGNTRQGQLSLQRCPNAQGFARRMCMESGAWGVADVSMCMSYEFEAAFSTAASIFSKGSTEPLRNRLMSASNVTMDVLSLTSEARDFSLLPMDLDSTNQVLAGVIGLLEESLESSENTTDLSNTDVLDIFSNVLEGQNLDGWQELTQIGDGTPKLLDNMERYALYQSRNVLEEDRGRRLWRRSNIAISFQRVGEEEEEEEERLRFPASQEDVADVFGFDFIPAQVEIPLTIFRARRRGGTRRTPFSSFLVRNMELAMPTTTETEALANETTSNTTTTTTTRIASMIISVQVDERGVESPELAANPAKLTFQFVPVENASSYSCAYWKFSDPVGSGFWAFDGVSMTSMEVRGDRMEVNCSSTHLTSFAVLVDVSGTLSEQNVTSAELQALQIVSYVGCAISIFFLGLAIIFFLSQGRDLCNKVHYFIHLHLSITLFLGYLLFVAAGETATKIEDLCIAVTTILHYLFLSSFCWMLCEGIMLYLLLVVVFSKLSKNVWFFLLVGYGLPVIPIVISVGIRHDSYGIRDQNGNLTFCWLSTEDGVIWAFAGPMLAIVVVNVFFLVMALGALYRAKRSQRHRQSQRSTMRKVHKGSVGKQRRVGDSEEQSDGNKNVDIFRTLLVAVVVLLPMLGLTWVLGLFAVNRNTTIFAWIFAVVNSFQGLFIFFFHVVRNEKVWKSARASRFRSSISYKLRSTTKLTSSSYDDTSNGTSSSKKVYLQQVTKKSLLSSVEDIKIPEEGNGGLAAEVDTQA